jgi:hypothetical protein
LNDFGPANAAMKFTINKKPLAQMLRILTQNTGRKRGQRDTHLRLAAQDGEIMMHVNDAEAGYEANVLEEGVCFFRYDQFLPLVRSYAGSKQLAIEVTSDGIQIGSTKISRGFWEVSLFSNPATAPDKLPNVPTKETQKHRGQQEFRLDS